MESATDIFDYNPTWNQNGVKSLCLRIEKIPDDPSLFENIKKICKCQTLKQENFQNFKLVFTTQEEFLQFIRNDPENVDRSESDMRIPDYIMKSIVRNNNNAQIQNLCKIVHEIFKFNIPALHNILETYLVCIDEKLTLSYIFPQLAEERIFSRVEKISFNESIPRAAEVISKLHLFPGLKYLNLNKSISKNEDNFGIFNMKLPQLKNLLHLNLTGNNLGPNGMKILCNLRHLKHLNTLVLTENNICDEGMKELRNYIIEGKLPVSELYINKNGLTKEGFKYFNEIAHTNFQRVLDFSNTPLSPEILEVIMDSKRDGDVKA